MAKYSEEIKLHMERASEALGAARQLRADGRYEAAARSASESALLAGSALLLDEEIAPEQHGDVIKLIEQNFVQRRRLTKEQGGSLSWLLALRNAEGGNVSDPLGQEGAAKALEIAESFLEATRVILEA
jgi:uncharacterized protein (UPF0332 family)